MTEISILRIAIVAIAVMLFSGIAAGDDEEIIIMNPVAGSQVLIIADVDAIGDENVDINNIGYQSIFLEGFKLVTSNGKSFSLPRIQLMPGEDVDVHFSNGISTNDHVYLNSNSYDNLNNQGGTIELIDNTGNVVSSVRYEVRPDRHHYDRHHYDRDYDHDWDDDYDDYDD